MKTVFQILLTIAIIVLVYMNVESINRPVRFKKEYEERTNDVVNRLKDIRTAQVAFRSKNKTYAENFDTLINFIKYDSLALIRMEGSLTDSMLAEGITEKMALELGKITRDTIRVSVRDSLFGRNPWIVDSLRYVPHSDGAEFEMGATILKTTSGVEVPVFEAKVHNDVFLKGLERQEVVNINDRLNKLERYQGISVGSLEEANNNAGNWE